MAIYGGDTPVRPAFPELERKPKKGGSGAGGKLLYIHVPFCRSKCLYCSFHSQPYNPTHVAWYHATLLKEIDLWAKRLGRATFKTVYFGGGTPSLLTLTQLDAIFRRLNKRFHIAGDAEITLEANPDSAHDVSWFRAIMSMGVNRLSLGFQSLSDVDLEKLGRPHNAAMASQSFNAARQAGMNNISVDLMWGLPGQRLTQWMNQLKVVATEVRPEHISAYGLSVDPGTQLAKLDEQMDLKIAKDNEQSRMFLHGADYLESMGYMHYEISNFARMGFTSRHNSGYWDGTDYLGLGPSAVSTLGNRRFENEHFLDAWDAAVRGGYVGDNYEVLNDKTRLQEFIMLSLRTAKGMDLAEYKKRTGRDLTKTYPKLVQAMYQHGLIRISRGFLRLTKEGMLVSNVIIQKIAFPDEA